MLCLKQLIVLMDAYGKPDWIWFETILEAHVGEMLLNPLAALGYRCDLGAFDSHDFGLNESRTRLNIVGNRIDYNNADCSWLQEKHHNPWPACRCEPGVMSYSTAEQAEVAQGFPAGWTKLKGQELPNEDTLRRQALSGSVAVPTALWVADRLIRAMSRTYATP